MVSRGMFLFFFSAVDFLVVVGPRFQVASLVRSHLRFYIMVVLRIRMQVDT